MKRLHGYTIQVNEVSDGWQIVIITPTGRTHYSHSYIKAYAWKRAHEIVSEYMSKR